ncbi:hypothetical protein [Fusobacterium ulcerans]|uniref:hypothetical protein n=1 Tax=Fusobacterium ulcerans TaxID=861 RepID=UPI0026DB298D|nr:hypothetical protein [Fusobacterium ulcerans]
MFGKLLEEIMKKKKIKVKELSILSDVTEGYISDIKKEKAIPRKAKLDAILENMQLNDLEKEELFSAWEKDSSPRTFVEKYELLEKENAEYKELLSKLENSNLIDQIKLQKKVNEKLEKEKEKFELYAQLFKMLSEEDRKFVVKMILRNIEFDMREAGKYEENKKEIEKLKKEIENGIKYDF